MSIKCDGSHSKARANTMKKYIVSLAIAGAGAAVLASVALATPGSNAVGTIMARAAFLDSVDIKFKVTGPSRSDGKDGRDRDGRHGGDRDGSHGEDRHESEVIQVRDAGDTVMQQIVFAPGGHTGWHSHPGPAIALIKSGELTLYSGDDPACAGRTFRAGQAFVDSGQGHVHMGRNQTNQVTEVWVTYLDVMPVTGAVRIDVPDPGNCRF
jgi:hypothetical protein